MQHRVICENHQFCPIIYDASRCNLRNAEAMVFALELGQWTIKIPVAAVSFSTFFNFYDYGWLEGEKTCRA